jgi:hypothetical protein
MTTFGLQTAGKIAWGTPLHPVMGEGGKGRLVERVSANLRISVIVTVDFKLIVTGQRGVFEGSQIVHAAVTLPCRFELICRWLCWLFLAYAWTLPLI